MADPDQIIGWAGIAFVIHESGLHSFGIFLLRIDTFVTHISNGTDSVGKKFIIMLIHILTWCKGKRSGRLAAEIFLGANLCISIYYQWIFCTWIQRIQTVRFGFRIGQFFISQIRCGLIINPIARCIRTSIPGEGQILIGVQHQLHIFDLSGNHRNGCGYRCRLFAHRLSGACRTDSCHLEIIFLPSGEPCHCCGSICHIIHGNSIFSGRLFALINSIIRCSTDRRPADFGPVRIRRRRNSDYSSRFFYIIKNSS